MAYNNPLIKDEINDYFVSHAHRETKLLEALREETLKFPGGQMLSCPEQCQVLSFLVQLNNAKNILEIGTFTGYATLWMAQALPEDGEITTCEIDEKPLEIAKKYWQQSGVVEKIKIKLGDAKETMQALIAQGNQFEFIYLDADKASYPDYYELSLKLLSISGILVIDNVLYFGKYVHEEKTKATKIVSELNKKIQQDNRVNFSMLPMGGGVTLIMKQRLA